MLYLKVVWNIIQKDLILEWRQKAFFLSLLLLALLLLVISSMALEGGPLRDKGGGFIWVLLLAFSSISGYQLLQKEMYNGTWRGILYSPIDTSALFFAKWISHLILIFLIELILIPAYIVLFNFQVSSVPLLILTFILGTMGFTVVSTFISTLTIKSSLGTVLLPVLQLPLLIPLFLAVISLTEMALYGFIDWPVNWIGLLTIYNISFILLPWILFPLLTEVDS